MSIYEESFRLIQINPREGGHSADDLSGGCFGHGGRAISSPNPYRENQSRRVFLLIPFYEGVKTIASFCLKTRTGNVETQK